MASSQSQWLSGFYYSIKWLPFMLNAVLLKKKQDINILPAHFQFAYIITVWCSKYSTYFISMCHSHLLGCITIWKPTAYKVRLRELVFIEQSFSFSFCNCSIMLILYSFYRLGKWSQGIKVIAENPTFITYYKCDSTNILSGFTARIKYFKIKHENSKYSQILVLILTHA